MVKKKSFDPDKLVLSKSEILEFCDRVLKKWNKNPVKNTNNILAMNAVKTALYGLMMNLLRQYGVRFWAGHLNFYMRMPYLMIMKSGQV